MGCALRTGVKLPLCLPALLWRPLVGQPARPQDLAQVDSGSRAMAQLFRVISEQDFALLPPQTFTAVLSDKTVRPLLPGGRHTQVTYGRRMEYAALTEGARLQESAAQCAALRHGLTEVRRVGVHLCIHTSIHLYICVFM